MLNLQIGTADADVDNVGQLLAGKANPLAAADLFRKLLHVVQHAVDAVGPAHDVRAVDLHVPAADIPQRGVVDGTVLGEVDLVAAEHGIALALDAGLLGQLDEQVERLVGQKVLAEVEEDVGRAGGLEGAGEAAEAVGVGGKGLLEQEVLGHVVAVSLELAPRGEGVCRSHCVSFVCFVW